MRKIPTKNYNIFTLISENRPIDWKRVDWLRKQLKNNNMLQQYDILCNSKEKSMERYASCDGFGMGIIDGQHRFLSAKLENKTVYYTVDDSVTLDDVSKASAFQRPWTLKDHLHKYKTKGLQEYKKFAGYMSRSHFPISVCSIILCGGRGAYYKTAFEQGEMRCSQDWSKAEAFAEIINGTDTKKGVIFYLKYALNSRFVEAFWTLFKHKEYDHPRMMAKLEYLASTMQKCPDKPGFLRELSRVYNYNTRSKVRFYDEE